MNYSMDTIPLFGPYALRRLRAEDAADIFRSIDTQRPYLGRWLPFVAETHCVEQSEAVVAGMLADTANPVYTIRDGRAFAGLIGFKSADAGKRSVEIGYWLREEQQGKGIMTAAVRTLCETAFAQMGMRRVEIRMPICAKAVSRRWACGVSRSAAARATCRATPFPGGSGSGSAMWNRGARSSPTESGST